MSNLISLQPGDRLVASTPFRDGVVLLSRDGQIYQFVAGLGAEPIVPAGGFAIAGVEFNGGAVGISALRGDLLVSCLNGALFFIEARSEKTWDWTVQRL